VPTKYFHFQSCDSVALTMYILCASSALQHFDESAMQELDDEVSAVRLC